jgi:hypothetical protein
MGFTVPDGEDQSPCRLDPERGLGPYPDEPISLQSAPRSQLSEHRMYSLHACCRAGRGSAFWSVDGIRKARSVACIPPLLSNSDSARRVPAHWNCRPARIMLTESSMVISKIPLRLRRWTHRASAIRKIPSKSGSSVLLSPNLGLSPIANLLSRELQDEVPPECHQRVLL